VRSPTLLVNSGEAFGLEISRLKGRGFSRADRTILKPGFSPLRELASTRKPESSQRLKLLCSLISTPSSSQRAAQSLIKSSHS
jgi:hypothetical protein